MLWLESILLSLGVFVLLIVATGLFLAVGMFVEDVAKSMNIARSRAVGKVTTTVLMVLFVGLSIGIYVYRLSLIER